MQQRRTRTAAPKAPSAVTREVLEAYALDYLNRFDASADTLRRRLSAHARRLISRGASADLERVKAEIEELLQRYCGSGLVSDQRFAASKARGLRERGASSRAIRYKLLAKGVGSSDIDQALSSCDRDSPNADLDAARALARRKRLGPHRSPEARAENARRDIAALARAGFSYDIIKVVLGGELDDEIV